MEVLNKHKKTPEPRTWEEESGLLYFLSTVPAKVDIFNESFGFGINSRAVYPLQIDGNEELPRAVGFFLTRDNPLMPEFTYCLYAVLKGRTLHGYIGIYRDAGIRTVKELTTIKDFRKGEPVLQAWLTQLVRASCEKIML